MRLGLQRGAPRGEDKQTRVPDVGGLPLVIEMQREVISGLSPGQLPFCSLRRAMPGCAELPLLSSVFLQLFKITRLSR